MSRNWEKRGELFLPKAKEKSSLPPKDKEPDNWDCPHCGEFFDKIKAMEEGNFWVATVATFNPKGIPHATCPKCNKCMGCCLSVNEKEE